MRRLYFDYRVGKRVYNLINGEYMITSDDIVLATILGSCVSVCIKDYETGLAGMNHFFSMHGDNAMYGEVSMRELMKKLEYAGVKNPVAKMYGGSGTGRRNVEFAYRWLYEERIPVVDMDVGDGVGRKVMFYVGSGDVTVSYIKRLHPGDTQHRLEVG